MLSGWNSIWARVDLGSGEVGECWRRTLGWHWAASGMTWSGREVWRFASGSEPSQSQWRWRRNLMRWRWMLSGDNKKKINFIFFYNMKCKDVLDKKLRVAGENEIAWHESRWNVGLLSDSDRGLAAAWCEVYGSEDLWDALVGSRDLDHDRLSIREGWLVIMMSAASGMAWRHDSRMVGESGIWNSMTWESLASIWTGMTSDGDGGEGGECYRIEKLGWVSKK